jgi:predicted lipoprotein with Yx(FWY)xxD motif
LNRLVAAFVLVVGVVVFAGCGGGGGSTKVPSSTSGAGAAATSGLPALVSSRSLPSLGAVLVNGEGKTLYVFAPDEGRKVTCVGSCAAVWPPLKLLSGQDGASVSGRAKPTLLGSVPDPEGGRAVTYAGWPLYSYVADARSGTARGQGLKINGGYWYVITPAGKIIK